jgi:putative hydrolase of the HAD superfamily
MIRAVVFDIGGVLAYDVWENLLLDKGEGFLSVGNLSEEIVKKVGQELWREFACRGVIQEGEWRRLEIEYWEKLTKCLGVNQPIDFFIKMTEKFIKPIEGMISLIQEIQHKGLKLAICSNNNEFWFQRQAKKLNLYQFFTDKNIVLSCRVGYQKDSLGLEMFHKVTEVLGEDSSSCIFVDDRKENIERAMQCGMIGVLFPSHSSWGAQYLDTILQNMVI